MMPKFKLFITACSRESSEFMLNTLESVTVYMLLELFPVYSRTSKSKTRERHGFLYLSFLHLVQVRLNTRHEVLNLLAFCR